MPAPTALVGASVKLRWRAARDVPSAQLEARAMSHSNHRAHGNHEIDEGGAPGQRRVRRNSRECGASSCRCRLVPDHKLHLESPSWEPVTLVVSPALTPASLVEVDHLLPAASHAMASFFATSTARPLLQLLSERREIVVGLQAPLPVRRGVVFVDAEAALRHAAARGAGEWCVALPLHPPPQPGQGALRNFAA